jgi:hypothetical protein
MKLSIRNFLLSLTLLVPALQQTACADNVTYLYRSWDESTKTVKTETKTANATPLRSVAKDGEWMGLGDGWYYMEGDRINIQTLNILGTDVHLILGNNTIFECYGGIKLEEGHKLTIYGQSEGDGAGFLWAHQGTASSAKGYDGMAGIGSGKYAKVGDLVIHGGRIKAEGGQYGAGIGGGSFNGNKDKNQEGTITIYGGSIEANGGEGGAGIGGGSNGRLNSVTIYGGDIWATGGKLATGVGSGGSFDGFYPNKKGLGADGFDVKMYGGKLTAQGGYRGAGIGSGSANIEKKAHERQSGKFIIYNGEVTAKGGDYGAGIGGGCNVDGATVEISGGKVTATGGINAAGIGGGEAGNGGKLTVSGGEVRAVGTQNGAGIGGGEKHIRDSGNNSDKYADGKGGDIVITGGTVVAIAGEKCHATWESGGSAIGAGSDINKNKNNVLGTLDIKSFMKVTAGSSESSPERVFTAGERAAACHWRNYCKVEVCNHTDADAFSYTQVGTDKHRKYCRYCEYTAEEDHTYPDNHGICECGKVFNQSADMWTAVVYRVNSSSSTAYDGSTTSGVLSSNKLWIPAPREIEGLTFMQWMQDPETAPESIEMKDDEFNPEAEQSFYLTPKSNVILYPRYRYAYNEEWTWADDHSSATLTLKLGDTVVKSDIAATVTTEEQEATASENGYKRYTATAAWEKAPGITYQFTDWYETPYVTELTIQDNADNDDLLWENHGAQVHEVELGGRTIYRDGKWNTLVLPFDIDDLSVTDLGWSDLDLRTLSASSYDATTKTLKLTFTKVTKIEAGKPYIIRSEYEHAGYTELSDPTFRNVTINATDNSVQTDVVDFIGTYSAIELDASMTDVLYLGKDNTLRWPKGDTTLKSCRAAFVLKGAAAGADAAATRFVLDFGDGEVTGIETLERIPVLTGEDSNVFYTLGGRRMTGSQLPRGIYINKGKKVIIK